MMRLKVKVWGALARYAGSDGGEFSFEAPAGTTAGALLQLLSLPPEYVLMVAVNGAKCSRDCTLKDGDVVHILPLVAGG